MSARAFRVAIVLASVAAFGTTGASAARARRPDKPAVAPDPPPAPPAPQPVPQGRPYDGELLRLAEVLGALTTMRQLCGAGDGEQWRARMQALLDAEGAPQERKDRLAGAFNRGLHGYAQSYRTCTANARLVIERFLDESGRLARDVSTRYRAS